MAVLMHDEYWRFEPATYMMEALEAHYGHPRGLPDDEHHSDTEVCANYIVMWLEDVGVQLLYRGGLYD